MRKVGQSPEEIKKFFEHIGIFVTEEKIFGFFNEAMHFPYQTPSKENIRAVAALLAEMKAAAECGQSWDLYKKRMGVKKITKKRFNPDEVYTNDLAYGLVVDYLDGKYTHKEVIELFRNHISPGSDRQIERWIQAIKPGAKKTKDELDYIRKKFHDKKTE